MRDYDEFRNQLEFTIDFFVDQIKRMSTFSIITIIHY